MKLPVTLNEPPNIFDAEMIHQDLKAHKELWLHVFYTTDEIGVFGQPACTVRAIKYYLVTFPAMEEQLVQMAANWKPGRLEWWDHGNTRYDLPISLLPNPNANVLRVTWVI
jgi:hypothetical protein